MSSTVIRHIPQSGTQRNILSDILPTVFGADDHARLASLAEQCADRGVYVAISNHDTESTRDLYSGATRIDTLQAGRFFGARETANELLAIYAPT